MAWADDYDGFFDEPEEDKSRFISKEQAKPNNQYHTQEYACPHCGSYNTGQSTYTDYCNSCDWYDSY